jgi:O-antigen/teichoic acid export membrane protein
LDYKNYLNFKYIFTFSSINYLQSGVSFLVSVILARELGKEDFGFFSYGLVFANTISTLMQFGTDRTLVRDLVQLGKPNIVLCSAAWVWLVCGALIAAGVIIWDFLFSNLTYNTALIVAFCSFLGFFRGMSPYPWFDYKGKANYQSFILLVDRILFFISAITIIFFLQNEKVVIYVSFAQLICRIITLAIEWNFVLKTARLILHPVYATIKKILHDNIWVWLATIGNLLMTQANQFILNGKFGPKELANYGLSIQVITIVRLLQTQLQRLSAPSIAAVTKDDQETTQVAKKLYQYCALTFGLSLCIILPVYFLTPYIVQRLIGNAYLTAIPVLNVLYFWSAFYGVALIISQFLLGLRLQRFSFFSTIFFGFLSLFLADLFVEKYKAIGAAMSLVVSHFCSVLFQFFIVIKKIKTRN